jgi:hypothetical protein
LSRPAARYRVRRHAAAPRGAAGAGPTYPRCSFEASRAARRPLSGPGDGGSGRHKRETRRGRSARPRSAYARAGPGEALAAGMLLVACDTEVGVAWTPALEHGEMKPLSARVPAPRGDAPGLGSRERWLVLRARLPIRLGGAMRSDVRTWAPSPRLDAHGSGVARKLRRGIRRTHQKTRRADRAPNRGPHVCAGPGRQAVGRRLGGRFPRRPLRPAASREWQLSRIS